MFRKLEKTLLAVFVLLSINSYSNSEVLTYETELEIINLAKNGSNYIRRVERFPLTIEMGKNSICKVDIGEVANYPCYVNYGHPHYVYMSNKVIRRLINKSYFPYDQKIMINYNLDKGLDRDVLLLRGYDLKNIGYYNNSTKTIFRGNAKGSIDGEPLDSTIFQNTLL